MKKCTCIEDWRWGSVDKRIVYGVATLFFSLGILLDTVNSWDQPVDYRKFAIVTFNLLGFIMMVFYQFLNKWVIGTILVTVIALASMVPFARALVMLKQ